MIDGDGGDGVAGEDALFRGLLVVAIVFVVDFDEVLLRFFS